MEQLSAQLSDAVLSAPGQSSSSSTQGGRRPSNKSQPRFQRQTSMETKSKPSAGKRPPGRSHRMPAVPPPPSHTGGTPTTLRDDPIWKDSIFAPEMTVREIRARKQVNFSCIGFQDLVDQTYFQICSGDATFQRSLPVEAFRYYCAVLFWRRAVEVKYRLGEGVTIMEERFRNRLESVTLPVPMPIETYLRCMGEVMTSNGERYWSYVPPMPDTVNNGIGGYWSRTINPENHNLYEELPCLGIFAEACSLASNRENVGPWMPRVVPDRYSPTNNLIGYARLQARRPESVSIFQSCDITPDDFPSTVPHSGFNLRLVERVGMIVNEIKSFELCLDLPAAQSLKGSRALLLTNKPDEISDVRYSSSVFRTYTITRDTPVIYGLAAAYTFQAYKEGNEELARPHLAWMCIQPNEEATPIPAGYIANRNARREEGGQCLPVRWRDPAFVSPSFEPSARRELVVTGLKLTK